MSSPEGREDVSLLQERKDQAMASAIKATVKTGVGEEGTSSRALAGGSTATERREMTIDQAVSLIGIGPFQTRMFLLCGLAFMADAVEVMILSFLQVLVKKEWDLSSSGQAALTAIVFAGELFGALFWGPVADRYGRRKGYLYSTLMVAVCGIISAFSPSYHFLLLCRACVGFGVAGLVIPFDLLAETLPPSARGSKLMATNFFWTFGSVYVAVVAWLVVESVGWRVMALLASLPLVLAAAMFPLLPESPRWLMAKGKKEETVQLMHKIAHMNKSSLPEGLELSYAVEPEGSYRELFSRPFLRTSLVLWALWCGYGFTYYGLVLSMPRIFGSSEEKKGSEGSSDTFNYSAMFVSTLCEAAGVVVAMLVIDRWGRKWSQCIMYVGAGIFMVPLSFGRSFSPSVLTLSAGIARAAIMGASCATWVATPEIYPTHIRATGHGFANAVARIGAGITPFFCDNESLSLSFVILTYAIVNILIGLAAMLLPYETSGKSLDHLQAMRERSPEEEVLREKRGEIGRRQKTENAVLL